MYQMTDQHHWHLLRRRRPTGHRNHRDRDGLTYRNLQTPLAIQSTDGVQRPTDGILQGRYHRRAVVSRVLEYRNIDLLRRCRLRLHPREE